MRFLVTGGSGFLGKYVLDELSRAQHDITCIVRNQRIHDNHCIQIQCDLAYEKPDFRSLAFHSVVHIAGKAHVIPKSGEQEKEFLLINQNGTSNLLKALDLAQELPKSFINISSVAVYGKETGELIEETEPLLATTPYGNSKIESERLVKEWCNNRDVNYYNLRLPLIAGNNPPGNLGKLIRIIKKGRHVQINNNTARKSIVAASEVAQLISTLQYQPSGSYNLCGTDHPTFNEIENAIKKAVNGRILLKVNKRHIDFLGKLAATLAHYGLKNSINSSVSKITSTLTFSDEKARKNLNWLPKINILDLLSTIKYTDDDK